MLRQVCAFCVVPQGYHGYIDEMLPAESPYLYGLHPNAEIGFLTITSEKLFRTILELQPKDSSAAGAGGVSREEKVGSIPNILPFTQTPQHLRNASKRAVFNQSIQHNG